MLTRIPGSNHAENGEVEYRVRVNHCSIHTRRVNFTTVSLSIGHVSRFTGQMVVDGIDAVVEASLTKLRSVSRF